MLHSHGTFALQAVSGATMWDNGALHECFTASSVTGLGREALAELQLPTACLYHEHFSSVAALDTYE